MSPSPWHRGTSWSLCILRITLVALGVSTSSRLARAEIYAPLGPPRYSVITVGVAGERHKLSGEDEHTYNGNSGRLSLGGGYVGEQMYFIGHYDIHMGPYEPIHDQQIIVDHTGTGITLSGGTSLLGSLRNPKGTAGIGLSLAYLDTIGRSTGRGEKDPADFDPEVKATKDLLRNYQIRITTFAVIPALFVAWFDKARPQGNNPELLTTRVEGSLVTLGLSLPVLSRFDASYSKKMAGSKDFIDVTERGRLRGYSLVLSWTGCLGL